eukprot:Ihof_evm6s160 gene=Ihof_evmTU6s160
MARIPQAKQEATHTNDKCSPGISENKVKMQAVREATGTKMTDEELTQILFDNAYNVDDAVIYLLDAISSGLEISDWTETKSKKEKRKVDDSYRAPRRNEARTSNITSKGGRSDISRSDIPTNRDKRSTHTDTERGRSRREGAHDTKGDQDNGGWEHNSHWSSSTSGYTGGSNWDMSTSSSNQLANSEDHVPDASPTTSAVHSVPVPNPVIASGHWGQGPPKDLEIKRETQRAEALFSAQQAAVSAQPPPPVNPNSWAAKLFKKPEPVLPKVSPTPAIQTEQSTSQQDAPLEENEPENIDEREGWEQGWEQEEKHVEESVQWEEPEEVQEVEKEVLEEEEEKEVEAEVETKIEYVEQEVEEANHLEIEGETLVNEAVCPPVEVQETAFATAQPAVPHKKTVQLPTEAVVLPHSVTPLEMQFDSLGITFGEPEPEITTAPISEPIIAVPSAPAEVPAINQQELELQEQQLQLQKDLELQRHHQQLLQQQQQLLLQKQQPMQPQVQPQQPIGTKPTTSSPQPLDPYMAQRPMPTSIDANNQSTSSPASDLQSQSMVQEAAVDMSQSQSQDKIISPPSQQPQAQPQSQSMELPTIDPMSQAPPGMNFMPINPSTGPHVQNVNPPNQQFTQGQGVAVGTPAGRRGRGSSSFTAQQFPGHIPQQSMHMGYMPPQPYNAQCHMYEENGFSGYGQYPPQPYMPWYYEQDPRYYDPMSAYRSQTVNASREATRHQDKYGNTTEEQQQAMPQISGQSTTGGHSTASTVPNQPSGYMPPFTAYGAQHSYPPPYMAYQYQPQMGTYGHSGYEEGYKAPYHYLQQQQQHTQAPVQQPSYAQPKAPATTNPKAASSDMYATQGFEGSKTYGGANTQSPVSSTSPSAVGATPASQTGAVGASTASNNAYYTSTLSGYPNQQGYINPQTNQQGFVNTQSQQTQNTSQPQ